jgi:hypothetical protein
MNNVPSQKNGHKFRCHNCGAFLPDEGQSPGDTSQAVGFIGGAALGAAMGGPVGAVVGGIIGAILGKEGKGIG